MDMTAIKSSVSCVIAYLLIVLGNHAYASSDEIHQHWIGLFPGDFSQDYIFGKKRNNTGNWTVPVYASSDPDTDSIGSISIEFVPNKGLSAEYNAINSATGVWVKPHLFDSDYGYGPYFHLTIIEKKNSLYKIRITDSEHYWADFAAEFGANNIAIIYLNANEHRILNWENGNGDIESIFVEHADADSLVVRSEQPIDMECGNKSLRYAPYRTQLVPMSEWIKPTGESRFNIPYTRGC